MTLARFRADPRKIRVSIRRTGKNWLATITERSSGKCVIYLAARPRQAVRMALRLAMNADLDGIDLGMGWAYEHPQHPEDRH